jgi:hypothetical protein
MTDDEEEMPGVTTEQKMFIFFTKKPTAYNIMKFAEKHAHFKFQLPKNPHIDGNNNIELKGHNPKDDIDSSKFKKLP